MSRILVLRLLLFVLMGMNAAAVYSQTSAATAAREKTRERLNQLFQTIKPETIKTTFRQSEKQPFVFVAMLKEGLTNADSFEIVVSVTNDQTIFFRVFPHYKSAYVNIDKVKNSAGLMRRMLQLNESAFLSWGADESGDIFFGYTFTLESGFPDEAIKIVLSSIKNSDKFIGDMRPDIDGSAGQ